jgi:hypothetical protein
MAIGRDARLVLSFDSPLRSASGDREARGLYESDFRWR